jgi:hypothetical protein
MNEEIYGPNTKLVEAFLVEISTLSDEQLLALAVVWHAGGREKQDSMAQQLQLWRANPRAEAQIAAQQTAGELIDLRFNHRAPVQNYAVNQAACHMATVLVYQDLLSEETYKHETAFWWVITRN